MTCSAAGVAVMARPPGKRNSTIHLLSGGEKALTAVALVFSIFDLNPAPFCLLDEVDAPLDEHNVGRFCDIVREMSARMQFIIITHNKATMELASQLIGVTMSEPGVSRLVSVDIDAAIAPRRGMTASADVRIALDTADRRGALHRWRSPGGSCAARVRLPRERPRASRSATSVPAATPAPPLPQMRAREPLRELADHAHGRGRRAGRGAGRHGATGRRSAGARAPVVEWPPEDARRILCAAHSGGRRAFRRPGAAPGARRRGLRARRLSIYHKAGSEDRAPIAGAASLTQPGSFDLATMDTQRYGGLNLFAVLPGPLPAAAGLRGTALRAPAI